MQLGMIGLGRMGANIVRRLMKNGHECVVFNRSPEKVKQLTDEGADASQFPGGIIGTYSLDDFVSKLSKPRAIWLMVPAGEPTANMVKELAQKLEPGDMLIDGGNSYYIDDIQRASELAPKGIHYLDVGTSGGVWGLERGYCMMIGGPDAAVKHLDPIFKTIAPGRGEIERTPGREQVGGTAESGYLHCGVNGAGHFVKMVHNGIEYGLMAAYSEGLNVLHHANVGKHLQDANAETTPLRQPEHYQYDFNLTDVAEVWRRGYKKTRHYESSRQLGCSRRTKRYSIHGWTHNVREKSRGSVISSWLLDLTALALLEQPEAAPNTAVAYRILEKDAGRLPLPLMKVFLFPFSVPHFFNALVHAVKMSLPISCFLQCGFSLVVTWSNKDNAMPQTQTNNQPANPCTIVIFGAAGDLTKRLLMPALYNLAEDHLLPKEFALVGVAHTKMSRDEFRDKLTHSLQESATVPVDAQIWEQFQNRLYYLQGDFQETNTYQQLQTLLTQVEIECNTQGNILFYLATASNYFGDIVTQLGALKLTHEANGQWRRVVIEKPFGHDLESARALNQTIANVLSESQIYRIDHFLGKETVQNILVFRFGNGLFEPIWNHEHIDHVQITVAETVGVEGRGSFYEGAGALRDMVQNHLFQLLAMTAMEPPVSFEADAVRDQRAKVIKAIHPLTSENAVRGQYGEGTSDNTKVPAYRAEPKVAADSSTETYVALKLTINNPRWADVPFYLRTGKHLPKRVSEVAIQFKQTSSPLFEQTSSECKTPNFLVLRIQPNESIRFQFGAKIPGPKVQIGPVEMDFCYADYFSSTPGTGYETLLYDCMTGDATPFQRSDNVELGWSVVMPILDAWSTSSSQDFPNYPAGTWGPKAADDLLAHDHRHWRTAF